MGSTPYEDIIWDMAERFGWTLEYVRGLKMSDMREFMQVCDGRNKAAASNFRKVK